MAAFLDPFSMYTLKKSEKYFFKILNIPVLYRNYCRILLNQHSQVTEAMYEHFRMHIAALDPYTIRQTRRNELLTNTRKAIWKKDPELIKSEKSFFGKYKDHADIFYNGPMLRLDGYYWCCEVYFRKGLSDQTTNKSAYLYIKYYRYFRFFEDGRVLCDLSTKFRLEDNAAKQLTLKNYAKETKSVNSSLKFGEYIVENDKIFVKMPQKSFIGEFNFKLLEGEGAFGTSGL